MSDNDLLPILLTIPFVASAVLAFVPVHARNLAAWLSGLSALAALGITAVLYGSVRGGNVVRNKIEWLPSLGLDFDLRLDGFAWIFAILITAIGFLVVLYARYYISKDDPMPRFFAYLLSFMGAMLGIVLSGSERIFTGGMDVPHLLSHGDDKHKLLDTWNAFFGAVRTLAESRIPVVAVDGADGLVIDTEGADHLQGGEDLLITGLEGDVVSRLIGPGVRCELAHQALHR